MQGPRQSRYAQCSQGQRSDSFHVEFTAQRDRWRPDESDASESDSDGDPWAYAQFSGYPHFHATGGFGGSAWAGAAHEDGTFNTWYGRAAAGGARAHAEHSFDNEGTDSDDERYQRGARGGGATFRRGGGPWERHDPEMRRHLGSLGLEKLPGSAPELRAAFQGAAKRFHPDMVSSGAASSERFQQAQRAYQYLRAHVAA